MTEIQVHPLTNSPMKVWEEIKNTQVIIKQEPLPLDTPIYPDKVRFVCMSDTHCNADAFKNKVPRGDVFLHCGDFTYTGQVHEVEKFNAFLGTLEHRHKIVIAGNHELTFDEEILPVSGQLKGHRNISKAKLEDCREYLRKNSLKQMSDILKNCTFLDDSETNVCGLQIYGSPWQPAFCHWAFNAKRGKDILEIWNAIPSGVDVLMTHGPPLGRGDNCVSDRREGCVELLSTVQQRVKPKFHVFGHIHEGRDRDLNADEGYSSDGVTTYINASNLNHSYKPIYPPVIFDIPLPPGAKKD